MRPGPLSADCPAASAAACLAGPESAAFGLGVDGFWALLIIADEFVDLAGWTWYVLVGMAALPTLACTVAVLHATPRRYLKPQKESVFAHLFIRFLALTAAFMVWGLSVVASASISTTVQALAGNSERAVTSLGFNLLLAAVPLVVSVLWMALIVRCAWFLRRLRAGADPEGFAAAQEIPAAFAPTPARCGGSRPPRPASGSRAWHFGSGTLPRCRGTHAQCDDLKTGTFRLSPYPPFQSASHPRHTAFTTRRLP